MKMKVMAVAAAALFTVALCSLADAKPRHRHVQKNTAQQTIVVCNQQGCSDTVASKSAHAVVGRNIERARRKVVSYLPHPPGCPPRLFCACGAAVEVFGGNGRDYKNSLWAVSSWHKFPRSNVPSAGDVALRSGHMFVLRRHVQGDTWLTADYNSGRHLSRLQEQSIRGYTIVSPTHSRTAQLAR